MTALYSQVTKRILDAIKSGALKVGDRLPPEKDYAAELGVSRSTLRLAYSELERTGILKRRKRAGTEIIADRPKPQFNMRTGDIHEVLSLGRDTMLDIDGKRTVAESEIALLASHRSETGYWLEISGTRSLPGQSVPFNVSKLYVTGRYAGIEPVLGPRETSVFQVIESTFGVAVGRVNQSVKAVSCPPEVSEKIGLAAGDPALLIQALIYDKSGSLMEVTVAYFDPERFQVRTDVEI